MSNLVTNIILEQANDLSTLLLEEDIVVDLTELVFDVNDDFFVGYYFTDDRKKIIAGKVIDRQHRVTQKPRTWITIPAREIPLNAVTLSFFVD